MIEISNLCRGQSALALVQLSRICSRSLSSITYDHKRQREFLLQMKGGAIELIKDENTGLARVLLNFPERKNALSGKMMVDFSDIVYDLERWSSGRGVLLYGSNRTFCSGGDLTLMKSIMEPTKGEHMCHYMQHTLNRFFNLPLVTLALIEGKALGGGAEVACACDFRAIGADASIGFVQARLGVSPGFGGVARLVEILGRTKALYLLSSARVLNGKEAKDVGLADVIVANGLRAVEEAEEFLKTVTVGDAAVTQAAKRVVVNASSSSFDCERTLEGERNIFKSVWGSPAHVRAMSSDIKFTDGKN